MAIFDVEIWGTVASWVSAVGTTGSVAAAATYYIYDKRIEAKAQARHIKFETKTRYEDGRLEVIAFNHSDKMISDFTMLTSRTPLALYLKRLVQTQPLTLEKMDVIKKQWAVASGGSIYMSGVLTGLIAPGGHIERELERKHFAFQDIAITFKDALAQEWELTLDENQPRRVREQTWKSKFRRTQKDSDSKNFERIVDAWLEKQ